MKGDHEEQMEDGGEDHGQAHTFQHQHEAQGRGDLYNVTIIVV